MPYFTNGHKTYLELDVWIPDLNLGFEYQVYRHLSNETSATHAEF